MSNIKISKSLSLMFLALFFIFSSSPIAAQEESAKTETGAALSAESPFIIDVLDLKNMDILDVLKLISQKSGLNIVANQNVKGRITIFLKNIEALQALKIIVDAYDWAYEQDGEIVKVITSKDYELKHGHLFGQEMQTRIRQLLYANVSDILAMLNQIISAKLLSYLKPE